MTKEQAKKLIQKLAEKHSLSLNEYKALVEAYCLDSSLSPARTSGFVAESGLPAGSSGESFKTGQSDQISLILASEFDAGEGSGIAGFAARLADGVRREIYGNDVYIRGLIEVGNVCRNDCYYCGIRKSNAHCERYVLSKDTILRCADEGYELGFRTFVLQGGEGVMPVERVIDIVCGLKEKHPDCAVTLSLGEYSRDDYQKMFDAGADRYLLRHETADKEHYKKLHPAEMSFDNRMRCLRDLKEIGFQVGCGFMVGSPYQTSETLAKDLKFIEEFSPDMCGIGPFIPQKDSPFKDFPAGTAGFTCYLLSLIRLIKPNILLPATTALGTIEPGGREKGIKSGANVVMPNLSPPQDRAKYALYDNKLSTGVESAEGRKALEKMMEAIGYRVVTARGDVKKSGSDNISIAVPDFATDIEGEM